MLATRDLLFCRDGSPVQLRDNFSERQDGLVFWLELRGQAERRHPFLGTTVAEQLRRNGIAQPSGDLQSNVIMLLKQCHPAEISKAVRAHLVFCDLIVVQRGTEDKADLEIALGLPSLMRLGILDTSAAAFKGLFS